MQNQINILYRMCKNMIVEDKSKKYLDIIFKISPVENIKEYNVRIIYEALTKLPQVYIETLELDVEDKYNIPHNYRDKRHKWKRILTVVLIL